MLGMLLEETPESHIQPYPPDLLQLLVSALSAPPISTFFPIISPAITFCSSDIFESRRNWEVSLAYYNILAYCNSGFK